MHKELAAESPDPFSATELYRELQLIVELPKNFFLTHNTLKVLFSRQLVLNPDRQILQTSWWKYWNIS